MQELETLRLYIRETLRNIKKQQKTELVKETTEVRSLRKTIRKMLRETQDTTQHNSTGLNALEKLLSSIIPIIETGYKDLKTDENQRKSFKSHILRGIQNLLSTASVYFNADKKTDNQAPTAGGTAPALESPSAVGIKLKEQDIENADPNKPESDPQFIDIDKKAKAEKPNPLNAFQTVQGEDLTGRNFALETFKKVQKQILETYSLLSNEEDRETFYDYLITNTKLYFDKFEDELKATAEEPTTPEYEAEKAKKAAAVQGTAPVTGGEVAPAAMGPEASLPPEEAPPV